MNDLIGWTFDGYELKELINNETRIYKALGKKLGRWVVIKVVPIEIWKGAVDDTILTRIEARARAIAALRHCNISIFYGYGLGEDWAYTITEYISRGSLKQRLEAETAFASEQALAVIIPIAQALVFAHGRGVIHRNISPANILMPQDDWPLLVFDLELTEMLSSPDEMTEVMEPEERQNIYAAHEQIQGVVEVDARADIYSLGLVLYQLLSGKLPFEGETSFDFLMARLTESPLPVVEANPAVPPIFNPILDKALAPNPDQRYQSMGEFLQALVEAREKLGMPTGVGAQLTREEDEAVAPGATRRRQETKIVLRLTDSDEQISIADQPELIVGRASKKIKASPPTIDLAPHGGHQAGVSRQHGRLLREKDQWFIEDLGSANGTFVNGAKIPPNLTVPVNKGDLLRFGQVELEFRLVE